MSGMNRRQAYTLFFCHLLSAWNARCYEFAAVLFTHAAYPGGLRAVSFLGIATSLAVVLFGSSIGRWIDNAPSRLRALLTTIAVNRCVIISACALWFMIVEEAGVGNNSKDPKPPPAEGKDDSLLRGHFKTIAFATVLALGIVENLSRRGNVISIQRDWVPVLAPPVVEKPAKDGWTLVKVDATMTGINLVCELLAPFVISGFLAFVGSMRIAVITVGFVNGLSIWLEFATARWIAGQFIQLRTAKNPPRNEHEDDDDETDPGPSRPSIPWYARPIQPLVGFIKGHIASFKLWMSLDVCLSSLAFCILHTNLLSISSTTVVFLLNSGYSLRLITIAEAVSATFEFASTLLTPYLAHRLSPPAPAEWEPIPQEIAPIEEEGEEEEEPDTDHKAHHDVTWAISRIGAFGITEMFFTLAPTIPLFIILTTTLRYPISREDGDKDVTFHSYPVVTVALLLCLAASRLGRGTFGLATTQLAQARVPDNVRASFAGVEFSLGQIFGLLHNIGTAIYSHPKDYGWMSCASFVAVAGSACLYWKWFLRERREEKKRSSPPVDEDDLVTVPAQDTSRVYGTFDET